MDSLTQFTLGAVVAMGTMGRSTGARKAVLVGGVLGTMPDLDVLYPFDNPIDSFVLHRGASHSLIVHTLVAPLFGWLFARLLGLKFRHATIAVWLIFVTHALLDAMTVYGTQIWWPLSREPVGVGSLFIIDPFYTLPLLVVALAGLAIGSWGAGMARATAVALSISTAYVGWSFVAQNRAEERASALLHEAGIAVDRLQATPLPFNTLFWRAIAVQGSQYVNIYVPLLSHDTTLPVYAHKRVDAVGACALEMPEGQRLEAFADGFVKAMATGDRGVVTDLRMGVTPSYVFSFAIATAQAEALDKPIELEPGERASDSDWRWLWEGILGRISIRDAEREALVTDIQTLVEISPTPACSISN